MTNSSAKKNKKDTGEVNSPFSPAHAAGCDARSSQSSAIVEATITASGEFAARVTETISDFYSSEDMGQGPGSRVFGVLSVGLWCEVV